MEPISPHAENLQEDEQIKLSSVLAAIGHFLLNGWRNKGRFCIIKEWGYLEKVLALFLATIPAEGMNFACCVRTK